MPQSTDQLISDPAAGVHADSMEALHVVHPTPKPDALKTPAASAAKKPAASGAAKPAGGLAGALDSMPSGGATTAPKMHTGGPVVTDGTYQLQAGEHVLTAAQAKMARHHALMVVGMKRGLTKPAAQATAGQPTEVDKAHKTPEKKKTKGVTVRPEKNQSAKIVDKTKK